MTKIIVYCKKENSIYFLVNSFTLEFSIAPCKTLTEFAILKNYTRHEAFDYSVGDAGKAASLMEASAFVQSSLETWLLFPLAAKKLTDGDSKRLLQLAVQYISSGGIEDNLAAGNVTAEMIRGIDQRN